MKLSAESAALKSGLAATSNACHVDGFARHTSPQRSRITSGITSPTGFVAAGLRLLPSPPPRPAARAARPSAPDRSGTPPPRPPEPPARTRTTRRRWPTARKAAARATGQSPFPEKTPGTGSRAQAPGRTGPTSPAETNDGPAMPPIKMPDDRVVDHAQRQRHAHRRPPEPGPRCRNFSITHAVKNRIRASSTTSVPIAICSALARFAVGSIVSTGTRP